MTRRECSLTRSRLLDLEDGRLAPDDAAAVRAHLAECAVCGKAWERWQADDRRLRSALRPVAVPRDLAGAAVARLRRGGAPPLAARRRVPLLRWGVAAAAAAALAAFGAWALLRPHYAPIGQLASVEGELMARQRGARRLAPVGAGATIYNGDELVAGLASRAAVAFYDKSRLALGESTGVELHSAGEGDGQDCGADLPHVCLRQGEVECELHSLRYFRAVGTPLGAAIVQGTRFRMKHVAGQRVLLEVLEGEVLFSSPNGQVSVRPGGVWAIEGTSDVPRRLPDGAWHQ